MGRASRAIRHELRYRALRILLAMARPLPLSLLRAGGALLGEVALALAPRSRSYVRRHLELAFPEQSEDWRAALARRTARHAGTLLGEVAWLWSVRPERLLARTRFEGLDHLAWWWRTKPIRSRFTIGRLAHRSSRVRRSFIPCRCCRLRPGSCWAKPW